MTARARQSIGLVALLGATLLAMRAQAMFVMQAIQDVPVERLIGNLQQQIQANTRDVTLRINLARVHAMAYARKSESAAVQRIRQPDGSMTVTDIPSFPEWFGPGFRGVQVQPTEDVVKVAAAKAHLALAISGYEDALTIAPTSLVARIGRAWCLDQAGEKARAVAGYRDIVAETWARESAGDLPGLQNIQPTTIEVANYLIPLLDPVRDAAEVATLRNRINTLGTMMSQRPVTPIVIPLTDGQHAGDLIDRAASVTFDLDGSGLPKRWTWITPNAGWLVWDPRDQHEVRSALQMFGSVTFWLFWENGYRALRALDDNGDGALTGAELKGLAIWRDVNGNGRTDAGEVRPLAAWGITQLSCAYDWDEGDPDVVAFSRVGVTFKNGRTRPTFDLWLAPR